MADVGGAGQGHHAHVEGEPKDDLADRAAVTLGDAAQFGIRPSLAVGGQERKAPGPPISRRRRLPNVPVPPAISVAPVLDETRLNMRLAAEPLNLFEGDIADTEQTARPLSWMASIARQGFQSGRHRTIR